MFNPPSQMMQGNQGNQGNDMNNAKKLPNPANYKIVKCKNYERGKKTFLKIFKLFIL